MGNFTSTMSEFGVASSAFTQTFNKMSENNMSNAFYGSNDINKFDEKLGSFDKKMRDWMEQFEGRESYKRMTSTTKVRKHIKRSMPPPPPPIAQKTVNPPDVITQKEVQLMKEINDLRKDNARLREKCDTLRNANDVCGSTIAKQ